MLKGGIIFLVIALAIGSIGVFALAKNNGNQGGYGQGMRQGNQSQIQACEQNQSQLKEQVKTQTQLQNCEQECNQNCTGECDGCQVQVSGAELRGMTINEIANLWEIDATTLLNKLIDTFDLKETYTINSTVNDLRLEYRFSPFEIKDMADQLKTS